MTRDTGNSHNAEAGTPVLLPRRTLLALMAGSSLGLLVGCADTPGPPETDHAAGRERVCGTVREAVGDVPAGLLAIGARYGQLYPDDDLHAIGAELPDVDHAAALAALSDRVRDDFRGGDVVDVDGWVLARTEARAAALLAGC